MNINLENLYSSTVTEKSKFNLHLFVNLLNKKELKIFEDNVEVLMNNGEKITNNAIRLCLKIYTETKLKVFPYIERCARKGWSVKDGTFSWTMKRLDDSTGCIGGYSFVKECIKQKTKLKSYSLSINDPQMIIDIDK